MDRAELINRMTVLFGGRAAESLIYHDVSTGAGDDLAKATDIARSMVVRFGMDKEARSGGVRAETGPPDRNARQRRLAAPPLWRGHRRSHRCRRSRLTDESFQRAVVILTANRALLDQSANELLAKETFSAEDLAPISARLAVAAGETAG